MNWTQEQRRETALAIFGMKHDWTDEPAEEKKKIALAVASADALLDELEGVEGLEVKVRALEAEVDRLRLQKAQAETKAQAAADELAENFKPYGVAAAFHFADGARVYGSAAAVHKVATLANEAERAFSFYRPNPELVDRIVPTPTGRNEFCILRGLPEAFDAFEKEVAWKERERIFAVLGGLDFVPPCVDLRGLMEPEG